MFEAVQIQHPKFQVAEPPNPSLLEQLAGSIRATHSLIGTLEIRLSPVCTPAPASACSPPQPQPTIIPLRDLVGSTVRAHDHLKALLESIEL